MILANEGFGSKHENQSSAVPQLRVTGCWLELQVDKSEDAVAELAQRYAGLRYPDLLA